MPLNGRGLNADEKKSSLSKMLPVLPKDGSKNDAKGFELPKKRAKVSRGSWNSYVNDGFPPLEFPTKKIQKILAKFPERYSMSKNYENNGAENYDKNVKKNVLTYSL